MWINLLDRLCCFQSIKVKKFESNSQLLLWTRIDNHCCFQSIKVKKFESNSQPTLRTLLASLRCFQSIKVKKFESNSQPETSSYLCCCSCFQSIKVKKFESNSQRLTTITPLTRRCFQSIKVKKFESNSQLAQILFRPNPSCFQSIYLQPVITQYFVRNKSEICHIPLRVHSKGWKFNNFIDFILFWGINKRYFFSFQHFWWLIFPLSTSPCPLAKGLCKGTTFSNNDKGKHCSKFYYFGGSAVCCLPYFFIP